MSRVSEFGVGVGGRGDGGGGESFDEAGRLELLELLEHGYRQLRLRNARPFNGKPRPAPPDPARSGGGHPSRARSE